jgi:glucose/arabinose dehydrogenase
MEAENVSKIACLSQLKAKVFCYPIKGLLRKQILTYFSLFGFVLISSLAHATLPKESYSISTIGSNLTSPWSMVELPDGTWLVTERDGHVTVIKGANQLRMKLTLDALYVAGQGGLLDVALPPNYQQSKEVLFSYAQGKLRANRLVLVKAKFNGSGFSKPEVIYQVKTDKKTPQHYAGRILVLPDNSVLLSSGDGFDHREQAQVVSSQLGKILRVNLDGTLPLDNPFSKHQDEVARAVFTLGHRNPQGLVFDKDKQRIISHEHGPAGGDEINILVAGNNYGWPVITFGKDYSQARISPFTDYPGMQKPKVNWTPSIAPSGMAYYGTKTLGFESLQGHVLVTALVDRKLYALKVSDDSFIQTQVFPEITGRLRDVLVTKQGHIAVLTDGKDAKLLLITND